MVYKRSKSYGKGVGGYVKSGYLKTRDHMEPYRKFSSSETEYSRKLRNQLFRDETSGPSRISTNYQKYRVNQSINDLDVGLTRTEVNTMIEESLKDAFKGFIEKTGQSQVPTEVFEVALNTADRLASHFQNIKEENTTNNETLPELDISKLNEVRQQQISEKNIDLDRAANIEDAERVIGEINAINSQFFEVLDSTQDQSETEKAISEVNPLLDGSGIKQDDNVDFVTAFDLMDDNQELQKRKRLDYDSEVFY